MMAGCSTGPPTKQAKHLSDEEASPPTLTEERKMDTTSAAKPEPKPEPKFRPYFIPAAVKDFVNSALYFALLHLINLVEATKADAVRSAVLCFLVEDANDVKKYCSDLVPFQEVMRDNTLWERLCKDRWKHFWGFEQQLKVAQAERLQDLRSKEFWYNKYHETEADATRNKIKVRELTSLTFSIRSWFNPLPSLLPNGWKIQPGIMPTGILYSETDSLRFIAEPVEYSSQCSVVGSGVMTGHPSGNMDWYLQDNGGILNLDVPRTTVSKFNSFRVRRLPNRGWELSSDNQVLRALNGAASPIEELWKDYTDNIQLQKIPEELKHQVGLLFPFIYREIPNIERLKNGLSWIRTGLEEEN